MGIAQIVPEFHPDVDPYDPEASLRYAARLMREYLDHFGGDYAKALADYNSGRGRVDRGIRRYGDRRWLILPEETRKYLRLILYGIGKPNPPGRHKGPDRHPLRGADLRRLLGQRRQPPLRAPLR